MVLCTGNSCRSQMAEGYLKLFANECAEIYSAGIEAHGLNPIAVEVMREDGIDITGQRSEQLGPYLDQTFDYILTVCDNAAENCPVFPGPGQKLHQSFPDPANATGTEEEVMTAFRQTRDMIKTYCEEFVEAYLKTRTV